MALFKLLSSFTLHPPTLLPFIPPAVHHLIHNVRLNLCNLNPCWFDTQNFDLMVALYESRTIHHSYDITILSSYRQHEPNFIVIQIFQSWLVYVYSLCCRWFLGNQPSVKPHRQKINTSSLVPSEVEKRLNRCRICKINNKIWFRNVETMLLW